MKIFSKISIVLVSLLVTVFLYLKISVLVDAIESTPETRGLEFACLMAIIPLLYIVFRDFYQKSKHNYNSKKYLEKLNTALVEQSQSDFIYEGNEDDTAKSITKQIAEIMNVDRVSIWMYNEERTFISCYQMYIKSDNSYYSGAVLHKKDFPAYFKFIEKFDYLSADDAENHFATSCFRDSYLKPLGIKSILDVPIWYKGNCIGVICVENLTKKAWSFEEISFSQLQGALFSFSYSMRETNILIEKVKGKEAQLANRMDAINRSNAVIEFTIDGIIKYANSAFLEITGYTAEEIVGGHHSMFVLEEEHNSLEYQKFWENLRKGEFLVGRIVRKRKNGSLIYLQATYNPIVNDSGEIYAVMKIATDTTIAVNQQKEIEKKNAYLEHAARILRHDMHSGINTYMPRGISSLERRLTEEQMKEIKIDAPFRMIKEGLKHTQKVYKGVYEFTNLVKKDVVLNREDCNLNKILEDYLSVTAYRPQVILGDLGTLSVNEPLFCTAIDNMIRNGLKYNDSPKKEVKILREGDYILVEDNGRGMSPEDFKQLAHPYTRKEGQKESGTGLGLSICIAIIEEHGFTISCEKLIQGTRMKIQLNEH